MLCVATLTSGIVCQHVWVLLRHSESSKSHTMGITFVVRAPPTQLQMNPCVCQCQGKANKEFHLDSFFGFG